MKIINLTTSLEPHSTEGAFRDRFFKEHLKSCGVRYRGAARHTFASQLLTARINERWIIKQMGKLQGSTILETHETQGWRICRQARAMSESQDDELG